MCHRVAAGGNGSARSASLRQRTKLRRSPASACLATHGIERRNRVSSLGELQLWAPSAAWSAGPQQRLQSPSRRSTGRRGRFIARSDAVSCCASFPSARAASQDSRRQRGARPALHGRPHRRAQEGGQRRGPWSRASCKLSP